MFHVGADPEKRAFYNSHDLFCRYNRALYDKKWTLDHFEIKLLKLKGLMYTRTVKKIARQRTKFMMLCIRQREEDLGIGDIILVPLFDIFIIPCKHNRNFFFKAFPYVISKLVTF